jgi:transposase InsO family protein
MQVFGLHRAVYRGARLASRLAAEPGEGEAARRDAVARWRAGMARGLTAAEAAQLVGVPRATLYRWRQQPAPRSRRPHRCRPRQWSPALATAVERLRRAFPMWGKAKLGPLLRRDGVAASDSTVGRILAALLARGAVDPVPARRRAAKAGRAPRQRPHARRLPKGKKPVAPGDIVQLDTLSVRPSPERTVKQFTAYDPVSRLTVAHAFHRATAPAAAQFLDKLLDALPYAVKAIQVDGGAEFMAEFETACRRRRLDLFVLPPKSPELNGAVERANGAWRYEFYAVHDTPHDLDDLNRHIDRFANLYNTFRPHGALNGLTPADYLRQHHGLRLPNHSTSHMY